MRDVIAIPNANVFKIFSVGSLNEKMEKTIRVPD
jgi:hypothetical protein